MRFRYLADPLFIAALFIYVVNRFCMRPRMATPFLHEHLNDLLCIPFWLPIMLFMQRCLRLRDADAPPSALEILIPLVIWSWMFEIWLPTTGTFGQWTIADPADIFWYTAGALAASIFWNVWYRSSKRRISQPISPH